MRPQNSTYWVFILHSGLVGSLMYFMIFHAFSWSQMSILQQGRDLKKLWRFHDVFCFCFPHCLFLFGKLKSLDLDRFQSRTRTCWVWHWHVESQTFTRLSMRVAHAEVQVSLPSATEGHLCGRNARPQWSRKRPEVFEPMVDSTGVSPVRLPFFNWFNDLKSAKAIQSLYIQWDIGW